MTLPATRHKPATPTPMPPWLLRHLETKTGGFRKARWTRCKNCQELILEGIDNDICAVRVQVDPTPITPRDEAWAAIAGTRTASLEIAGKAITIWGRDPLDIATPSRQPIVPHHRCGQRYPGFLLKPPRQEHDGDQPPF